MNPGAPEIRGAGLPAAALLLRSDLNIRNEQKQLVLWEEEACVWQTRRQQHMMEKEKKAKAGIMDTSASLSLSLGTFFSWHVSHPSRTDETL